MVGSLDGRLGERVCAFVVQRLDSSPISLDQVNVFLLERGLAKYKLPERLELVKQLPRNAVGKVP